MRQWFVVRTGLWTSGTHGTDRSCKFYDHRWVVKGAQCNCVTVQWEGGKRPMEILGYFILLKLSVVQKLLRLGRRTMVAEGRRDQHNWYKVHAMPLTLCHKMSVNISVELNFILGFLFFSPSTLIVRFFEKLQLDSLYMIRWDDSKCWELVKMLITPKKKPAWF